METNLKVKLIAYTPDAEKVVAAAAKLCYARSDVDTLMDNLTPDKVEDFIERLADLGHESPIEHASYTFAVEGVSRALLAQLTRHRLASYSVQSQRYVDKSDFDYIMPPEIAAIPDAAAKFEEIMAQLGKGYEELRGLLRDGHKARLMADGESEKEADFKAGKMANEDARFVLPNACDTRIIFTMNARSLHNFFRQRCCNRAQWEIRAMADQMLKLVREVSPTLFKNAGPSCVGGGMCSEGVYTCGKPRNDL
nr:FAD-dependent thymidylate synthase [Clostridia bacterium]